MALSGSITKTIDGTLKYQIDWTATQSVANNQSTITCKHYLKGSGYSLSIYSRTGTCTVDGTSKTYESPSISGSVTSRLLGTTTHVVTHNSDGSKSTTIKGVFNIQATLGGTYFSSVTMSKTVTLDSIPRAATITSAPDFDDEDNPTITYSNGAGTAVTSLQACIADAAGQEVFVPYRDISMTGTTYTFQLTNEERTTLRNAVLSGSVSRSVRFYIKTVIGGNTLHSSVLKTLTIVNAKPQIVAGMIDINNTTTALTGDGAKFIRYHSNLKANLNPTFKKGATAASLVIKNGDTTITGTTAPLIHTFEGITSNTVNWSVTDTRGQTATLTSTLTMIDYVHLSCNLEVGRPNALGEVYITLNGNCYNGSFGRANNTLTLTYHIEGEDGSVIEEQVVPTFNGNTYSIDVPLANLDYRQKYTFTASAQDSLESVTTPEIVTRTLPIFDWSGGDFNFNVPVTLNTESSLSGVNPEGEQVNLIKLDENGDITIGVQDSEDTVTRLYGSRLSITTTEPEELWFNGMAYGVNEILWTGGAYMGASQTIDLSANITDQPHGAVFAWSAYADGEAKNYNWSYFFVPKYHVAFHNGSGVDMNDAYKGLRKYLYISDKVVSGHSVNTASSTTNGIAYNGANYVLRYVIGV